MTLYTNRNGIYKPKVHGLRKVYAININLIAQENGIGKIIHFTLTILLCIALIV